MYANGSEENKHSIEKFGAGMLTQSWAARPPSPRDDTVSSRPLPIEFAWDLMRAAHRRPPWMTGSYHRLHLAMSLPFPPPPPSLLVLLVLVVLLLLVLLLVLLLLLSVTAAE